MQTLATVRNRRSALRPLNVPGGGGGAPVRTFGRKVALVAGVGACSCRAAARHPPLHPLLQTSFSPGAAATPQLFTQRKSLFADCGTPGGSTRVAGSPPDDRVKVVVRLRPPAAGRESSEPPCVQHTGVDTLALLSAPEPTYYSLNHCAGVAASQLHMFKVVGRPCVENALAGYNSTIFCYGAVSGGGAWKWWVARQDNCRQGARGAGSSELVPAPAPSSADWQWQNVHDAWRAGCCWRQRAGQRPCGTR